MVLEATDQQRDITMSRTFKDEHRTDGYHIGHRLERQARQPQRNRRAFAADLALDETSTSTSTVTRRRPTADYVAAAFAAGRITLAEFDIQNELAAAR